MIPTEFRNQIRAALTNPELQAALDANAERRKQARDAAYASLPEPWEIMRLRAHQVRSEVIENLDRYLEQFISAAERNGMILHHAPDAEAANEIVVSLAREKNAHLVAKSKTMVSEETGLNHALENAGIRVVETDLGEYIIQLRGERPAHIVTPAVHLRRAAVGRTFEQHLQLPYTEDIPQMTRAARQVLRQVFLKADIGLSGVNFGVAENGALCILTNEGNGRMVTTLPRIHIALMGIERLVRNYEDLALMLYLLPRSATGQKLTVYTSLITGPRRRGEPDGPRERHLILLDNGRQAMKNSRLAEMLYCIRCGACLNACPVFRELGGHAYVDRSGSSSTYPGPMGSVLSPGLFSAEEFGHLARASSLCGACKDACPVDIDLPKLLLRVRAGYSNDPAGPRDPAQEPQSNAPSSLSRGLSLYTWLATSARRFKLAQRLGGIFGSIFAGRQKWIRLPAWTGWGASKDFPAPALVPFHARWKTLAEIYPQAVTTPDTHPGDDQKAPDPVHPEVSTGALEARFMAELTGLQGQVISCSSSNLAARMLAFLEEREISAVQCWSPAALPAGLSSALMTGGISLHQEADPALTVGLTAAQAAVAETGSLLITAGPGQALSTSLLPPIHLAVLYPEQIYATLPQALAHPGLAQVSSAVWISGPSRTADIEMTLTIGVHGPGELVVFLVQAST